MWVTDKLNAYRRNGVQEYIVWQIYENRVDWFGLEEGRYIYLEPDADGVIRSQIFPGLWLAVSALREGNLAEVLAVLQQGLQTLAHEEFVHQESRKAVLEGRGLYPILLVKRLGTRS